MGGTVGQLAKKAVQKEEEDAGKRVEKLYRMQSTKNVSKTK
jgi:hypothetical protein